MVPFAGSVAEAERVRENFAKLRLDAGDELIVSDNTPANLAAQVTWPDGWRVVHATGEGSPARARNAGAAVAASDWIVFVDSDCRPDADLVTRYFDEPVGERTGIVAGRIEGATGQTSLAARYATSRFHLDAEDPLRHPYLPYVLTANCLVRREAWRRVGGYFEGIFNGEDVDFAWRVQKAGWTVEYRDSACVEHEHRESIKGLWRQLQIFSASGMWVHRRWPGVHTPPIQPWKVPWAVGAAAAFLLTGQRQRAIFKLLDGLVPFATATGRLKGNRARPWPQEPRDAVRAPLQVWVDQFPVVSETFVFNEVRELLRLGHPVEVIASRRPDAPALGVDDIRATYLEDDSGPEQLRAFVRVALHHPRACLRDRLSHRRWAREEEVVPLRRLAPAVLRLTKDPKARLHAHFAAGAALNAMRVAAIAGRPYSLTAHAYDIYLLPRNLPEKLRRAEVVTSGCHYTVDDLKEIAGPEHAGRVHKIVMGVDPDEFVRETEYPPARTVIGVGRLVEKKGFVDLVRAVADPSLRGRVDRLTLVGDGPEREHLEAEADRLGVGDVVEFTGRREPTEIRSALEGAAVLAMPCVVAADGDRDSMPVVVKEALAMEIPVVVSDEVGLPELVRPDFGRMVPPGDPEALAAALAELLDLPVERRRDMGRAGRRFVAEHANVRVETERLSDLLV